MQVHGYRFRDTIYLSLLFAVLAVSATASGQNTGIQSLSMASQITEEPSSSVPLTVTLQDALERAKKNSPEFQAVLTQLGLAREDRVQARAGMLPSVNYVTSYIYTQGNGTGTQIFVANNFIHEYIALGHAQEVLSPGTVAQYRRSGAALAVATAKSEIAARGLVLTVVKAYYAHVAAQRKYSTTQTATQEAGRFFGITQKLEQGGEVAHSDTIKAQIQYTQRERDLQEAQLEMNRSRLELAVLLFPNFNENFVVVDDLQLPAPVPPFAEVELAGTKNNPDLRAAVAAVKVADQEVAVAWSGLLPTLTLDSFYGIDAAHFATRQVDPATGRLINNLGYSASAALQLPVWDWFANRSKVKQANLRRHQARVELSFAQRQLLANLRFFYNEVQTSRSELDLLSQSAELASDSLRLTTLRYQAGEATVLEVVDAQNTLTLARTGYADGQVRYQAALATLQTITGTF
jgi:outer membrane protein TolC